jgi:hypothetical protein
LNTERSNSIIRVFSEGVDYGQQWNIFAIIKKGQKENGQQENNKRYGFKRPWSLSSHIPV